MTDLPERFLKTMQELLGEEYPSFLASYGDRRRYGLRVNTSKITREEFERIAPFHLTPIPWIKNGYYYEKEDDPAGHPFYAAGLYYLQEPSAMTPASRLPIEPGDRVLDLCAAPGGKATAMAADLCGRGQLVANDINTARARALLRNLELFGIRNSFVTNEPPYILAEKFPGYFDRIMVDAPCSGEGMFRKNPTVAEAWLEKGPEYFSVLQKEIILYAADMLKPGGTMFYSTCTFSPLENESVITWLLENRPEMRLIPMEDYEGFSEGFTYFREENFHPSCRLTRRIWPHRMGGEGHFLALLEKDAGQERVEMVPMETPLQGIGGKSGDNPGTGKNRKKQKVKKTGKIQNARPDKDQRRVMDDFFSMLKGPMESWTDYGQIEIRGDKVYYVSEKSYEDMGIHFLRNGVYLGDLKKNRFEPSQPFALILSKDTFSSCLNFPPDDERLNAYLRGETLTVDDLLMSGEDGQGGKTPKKGWYLILAEGYPLGFGKLSGSMVKNKYPAGWRRR